MIRNLYHPGVGAWCVVVENFEKFPKILADFKRFMHGTFIGADSQDGVSLFELAYAQGEALPLFLLMFLIGGLGVLGAGGMWRACFRPEPTFRKALLKESWIDVA